MKEFYRITFGPMFSIAILFCGVVVTGQTSNADKQLLSKENKMSYAEKSKAAYDIIFSNFYEPISGLFIENYPAKPDDKEICYLWSYVSVVSGVNALMKIGYDQKQFLPFVDRFSNYFDDRPPGGYASYPPSLQPETRFYDDNAIVGIELVDAYEISGDKRYLDQAEKALQFIFTGEDTVCGGGVYWNEKEGNGTGEKGISANGFSVYLALKLYQITKKQEYLNYSKRIYNWVKTNLQDPKDKIYWNGIYVRNCSVNKAIWTYNTAIMILSDLEFFKITGDKQFLDDAKQMGVASFKHFTTRFDGVTFYTTDTPWFNTVLLKAYIELVKYDANAKKYIDAFIESADYAWEKARNQYNLFYEDWSGRNAGRDYWLLHQACMIEVYGRISLYLDENRNQ